MTKKLAGVWHGKKVLCPQCFVPLGTICEYGLAEAGYWFQAKCPHCSCLVQWYRNRDFSSHNDTQVAGIQMSIFGDEAENNGKPKKKTLIKRI